MGGEPCASHAYDTGLPDDAYDLLPVHPLEGVSGDEAHILIKTVVLHHDAHDHVTGGYPSGLQRLHRAGCRRIHVCRHKAARLSDFLPHQHPIALCHQGFGRRADMLR